MAELPKLSKWQALFRNFPGSIWPSEKATFRTQTIRGRPVDDLSIAEAIASEISQLRAIEYEHYNLKQARRAEYAAQTSEESEQVEVEDYDLIERQIRELQGEDAKVLSSVQLARSGRLVDTSQIELIEVTDDSKVDVDVFPRSFRCESCGHYEIVDPVTKKDLKCPCCKGFCPSCGQEVEEPGASECPVCGTALRRPEMVQFSYIFACPRCANMEEFTHRLQRLSEVIGRPLPCPNCREGHLHFIIRESFTNAYWQCAKCKFIARLDKHCKCHIAEGPNDEKGRPSIMKPISTSAPSIAYPMIRSYLKLGADPVTLRNLELAFEDSKGTDLYGWKLSDQIKGPELHTIRDILGIEDAFSVPRIVTTTVVYGYKSGVSSYPFAIPEEERMAQLFKAGRTKFRAYLVNTIGRGLVIKLQKGRLLKFLGQITGSPYEKMTSYEEMANHDKTTLVESHFQPILDNPNTVRLVSLLHAVEHTMFKCAMEQVGLEVFGSNILIDDAAIILYEREEVGSGGLVELTSQNQFVKLVNRVWRLLGEECPNNCQYGCPACIYIHDFYCHPFVPTEVDRWFPPNSLLNRSLTAEFLESQGNQGEG